ncbi:hypothetical protein L1049_017118 [Liquidambar formosana]|uniref:Uncharacterized protein n=1 Tax=Liquidambar formosana TaxID=63359 RepID=A0AAP0S188_LIQFO
MASGRFFVYIEGYSLAQLDQARASLSMVVVIHINDISSFKSLFDKTVIPKSVNDMKLIHAGKRAFIAGVVDDNGYGWAIAKSLAAAGAEILVGTWVPREEKEEWQTKRVGVSNKQQWGVGVRGGGGDGGKKETSSSSSDGGKMEMSSSRPTATEGRERSAAAAATKGGGGRAAVGQ